MRFDGKKKCGALTGLQNKYDNSQTKKKKKLFHWNSQRSLQKELQKKLNVDGNWHIRKSVCVLGVKVNGEKSNDTFFSLFFTQIPHIRMIFYSGASKNSNNNSITSYTYALYTYIPANTSLYLFIW